MHGNLKESHTNRINITNPFALVCCTSKLGVRFLKISVFKIKTKIILNFFSARFICNVLYGDEHRRYCVKIEPYVRERLVQMYVYWHVHTLHSHIGTYNTGTSYEQHSPILSFFVLSSRRFHSLFRRTVNYSVNCTT